VEAHVGIPGLEQAELQTRTLLPSGPQLAQLTQLMDRSATAYMQAATISEDVIVGLEREAEAMRAGPGIVAFVALARGGFERARGQRAAAITAYEHAYYGAAATGDSETVLNAAIQLVDLLGIEGGDASRAIPYLRQLHAIAILRPDLAPIAYQVIGVTATARGDLPGAIAYLTRAKQLAEDADGSGTLAYAQTLFSLAIAYELAGRARDAVPLIERAIAVRAAVLGVDAPELAADHYNLGLLLISVGEIDRATREVEHAAAIDARWPERRPPIERATGLLDHGAVLAAGARYDEAVELETQALLGFAAAEGEDSLDVALALSTLASAHIGQGDYRRAAAAIGEALAIYERRHPDSLDVASALAVSGKIQVDLGRCDRARPMLRRALRLFRTGEPTGVRWTAAISGLAGCALEAGRPTEMLPELAEADHALHAFPLEPFGADVLFAYARCLGAAQRDPALARARALEARAVYAGLGELGRARLAAVDRWLAHR
ncbi:MAG: tetratricopeptide repeat protein, partial [Deltaproteobacteria bacterium]|nr:tetratricopeptide repeat protein [Deltaproteobacteria bacterium]